MEEIKKMVMNSKRTTYMGEIAWTVPNGKCTTSLLFACRCWKVFLDDKTTSEWLSVALMDRYMPNKYSKR